MVIKSNIIVENINREKEILSVKEIRYLEVDRRKLKVVAGDRKEYYIREKISDFEKKLDQYESLIRIGKSFIINVKYVDCWEKKGLVIEGEYISISPKRYEKFEEKIKNVMKI